MHFTPWPRWLRMVSTATVVFPVLRSPMISSRWPRPIGVIASMALIPVCSGSCTGRRATMPGAWISRRRYVSVLTGPLPSIGCPRALTTRPSMTSPTGTERMRPVSWTVWPSSTSSASPSTTAPIESSSRFSASPSVPPSNSSSSLTAVSGSPDTRAIPSPTSRTRPTRAFSRVVLKPPTCLRSASAIWSALMDNSAITCVPSVDPAGGGRSRRSRCRRCGPRPRRARSGRRPPSPRPACRLRRSAPAPNAHEVARRAARRRAPRRPRAGAPRPTALGSGRRLRAARSRDPSPPSRLPAPVSAASVPDLTDVALDERELGVAIEIALHDLLGEFDRQVRDPALKVGLRAVGREPDVLLRARPRLGRICLRLGLDLALHLVGGLTRLLDDPRRLVAGFGHLTPVVRELPFGLGARLLGPLEVLPNAVLPLLHHVPDRREPVLPEDDQQDRESRAPPDDLVDPGDERVRRLLAVVDLVALFEELDALLLGLAVRLGVGDTGRRDDAHEGNQTGRDE